MWTGRDSAPSSGCVGPIPSPNHLTNEPFTRNIILNGMGCQRAAPVAMIYGTGPPSPGTCPQGARRCCSARQQAGEQALHSLGQRKHLPPPLKFGDWEFKLTKLNLLIRYNLIQRCNPGRSRHQRQSFHLQAVKALKMEFFFVEQQPWVKAKVLKAKGR